MASLSNILRLNAASCLGFGALFLLAPRPIAAWLGAVAPEVLGFVGAGLLLNGGHLLWAARRPRLAEAEVLWFSTADLVWWLATCALVAARWGITEPAGIMAALVVATGVAGLGLAQVLSLGRARSNLSTGDHLRRIGRSWQGLPVWVKLWLVALNGVFLAAPLVWPWPSAQIVLLAYGASGPVLAAFAFWAGGMTRIMGLGHLIPWGPLLVWLVVVPQPGSGYALVLSGAVALCLSFDLYDLARWLRGDRGIVPPVPAQATGGLGA